MGSNLTVKQKDHVIATAQLQHLLPVSENNYQILLNFNKTEKTNKTKQTSILTFSKNGEGDSD